MVPQHGNFHFLKLLFNAIRETSRSIVDRAAPLLQSSPGHRGMFLGSHAYIIRFRLPVCIRAIDRRVSIAPRTALVCDIPFATIVILLRASPLPLSFLRGAPLSRDSDYILATSCVPTLPHRVHTAVTFTGSKKHGKEQREAISLGRSRQ